MPLTPGRCSRNSPVETPDREGGREKQLISIFYNFSKAIYEIILVPASAVAWRIIHKL